MAAIQFTALIRLPFPRGDFVDPQQADWSAAKDRALWKVISKSSKTSDLNWVELATRFQVPSAFLLQQAAWLYERHLDHVRTQMKKVGTTNASAPGTSSYGSALTTVGGLPMRRDGSGGGLPMRREGSGGGLSMRRDGSSGGLPMRRDGSSRSQNSRTPSAMSLPPRESPVPRTESATPGINLAPTLSRTPSTNTITQSRTHAQQTPIQIRPLRPVLASVPSGKGVGYPSTALSPKATRSESLDTTSSDIAGSSSSSSSESDSDPDNPVHRSQLFKRPPRFRQQRPRELISYDEREDEDQGVESSATAPLPFARAHDAPASRLDDSDPLTPLTSKRQPFTTRTGDIRREQDSNFHPLDASSSMASSASDAPAPRPSDRGGPSTGGPGPGPLSPRHRAELAKLNDRRAGPRSRTGGSEGTPSMGSSFSDIDDAGISQSALEEALLSNIQHGRMSTLSQLRSRYL